MLRREPVFQHDCGATSAALRVNVRLFTLGSERANLRKNSRPSLQEIADPPRTGVCASLRMSGLRFLPLSVRVGVFLIGAEESP
jgi:hypothetical protein